MTTWQLPEAFASRCLLAGEEERIAQMGLTTARAEREIINDRLEAIEDLTYYTYGDWGTWINSVCDPKDNRFSHDRAENYRRLWLLDKRIGELEAVTTDVLHYRIMELERENRKLKERGDRLDEYASSWVDYATELEYKIQVTIASGESQGEGG